MKITMPFLVKKSTNKMSSKFDSSILENIPDNKAEENIYFNTEEAFGGEYCDLHHTHLAFAQPRREERTPPNTQNVPTENSERTKRHRKVIMQGAAGEHDERLPVASINRGRTRLVSDSQLLAHSSRAPERMTDIHTRNAGTGSTFRTQPSATSERSRKIPEVRPSRHSYLNRGISEDSLGNGQNMVITDQPKPRRIVLSEQRRGHEEQEKHNPSTDPRENLRSKRAVLRDESKNEFENTKDFTRSRIQAEARTGNPRADKLDLNMNRARLTLHKQSSREERCADKRQGEEPRIVHREERQPYPSSDVSSMKPPRHLGMAESDTNDSTRRTRIEAMEMTNMGPVRNPRIQQLRREEMPGRNPLLGLAFPRPHSLDAPDNKTKILRTFSSPELRGDSVDELLGDDKGGKKGGVKHVEMEGKNDEHASRSGYKAANNTSSKQVVKTKGKRSKSLPLAGNTRNSSSILRRGQAAEASPLRYFAYLGKRFQFRERLLSTHNVLYARPVILTSTSVISPEVTTNFCQQLEDQGSEPCDDSMKHQGACQDLIDCCTCMCCVKALFYHCTKDDESEGHYAEHPCSCSGPAGSCLCRWSVLGMLSLVLPCILCYLPVLGCTLGVEHCRRKPTTPESSEQ